MRRKLSAGVLFAAISVAALVPLAGSAGANTVGTTEGCTPGFWKNHTNWAELTGEANVTTSLTWQQAGYALPAPYTNATLFAALSYGGGSGTDGAIRILLRAAASAYLNAAAEIEYPFTRVEMEAWVEQAVASGNRATMIELAEMLDTENNLGCPF